MAYGNAQRLLRTVHKGDGDQRQTARQRSERTTASPLAACLGGSAAHAAIAKARLGETQPGGINMTDYATHRFSVGQQVVQSGDTLKSSEVVGLIAGPDRPEYRLRSGSSEAIVGERELAYTTPAINAARTVLSN